MHRFFQVMFPEARDTRLPGQRCFGQCRNKYGRMEWRQIVRGKFVPVKNPEYWWPEDSKMVCEEERALNFRPVEEVSDTVCEVVSEGVSQHNGEKVGVGSARDVETSGVSANRPSSMDPRTSFHLRSMQRRFAGRGLQSVFRCARPQMDRVPTHCRSEACVAQRTQFQMTATRSFTFAGARDFRETSDEVARRQRRFCLLCGDGF